MKKLFIIGFTWPEPATTAAGNRMLQLIHFFLAQDYHITFGSTAKETEYSMDLESLNINKVPLLLNDSGFDVFVKKLNPSIVLFDRFLTEEQFGWRVAEFAPNALRILDTEDLHSLRQVREQAVRQGTEFILEDWLKDEITLRELASIYRSDLSLIISSYEMELLQKEIGLKLSLLLHLPFMTNMLPQSPDWPTFENRRDFLFIGGGKHAPNVDAIQQLKVNIWPWIRQQLPDTQLHVYGAYLPQWITQMHQPKDGFWIKGRAENVKDVMTRARVCLAPLRFGAGIKGKLLKAMCYGTPSVTSNIGAEGMHDGLPWNGTIVESIQDFAEAAVHLYTDQITWNQAQKAAITLVNTLYGKDTLKKRLLYKINELENSLEKHRTQNVVGRMLQHHTLASTKYLGKWIEAKNNFGNTQT